MFILFQCVAEAVVEKGLRGLAEMVPGGGAVFDIAQGAWKKYRERCQQAQQRDEIQRMAQATLEEVKQEAIQVARKVASGQPEILPDLELYLTQIPASIRQSLKRSDDPTGKTAPPNFVLRSADDVVKLLPLSLPRFRSGDALPGKPGWVLDRQIGLGGFGEVWLARKTGYASLVGAVKFCHNLQTRDRDMLHESKVIDLLLAQGAHANIVRLLDVHLDGDAPWLMYEYVEAGDLADLIHEWAVLLPAYRQQKVIAALHELAATIGHFHRLQPAIVHRDLKPANILRDNKGRLRITDFGISGIAARQMIENEVRGTTSRAGRLQSYLYGSYTPLYASPQQREGADPDARDDVHALGVIAYQMLTGQLSQGVGPDFVDDLKEMGIDETLIDLLRRCTSQRVERRPKDAGEIAEVLVKLCGNERKPVNAVEPGKADPYADVRRDEAAFWQAVGVGATVGAGSKKIGEFLDLRANERIARWKDAAQQGLAAAQFLYAVCLDAGIGIARAEVDAAAWYRKAANQGHAPAQHALAEMYEYGAGVTEDVKEAVAWYRKAAEQGYEEAQYHLGFFYHHNHEALDYKQAVSWYYKAAIQGDWRSQCGLGEICEIAKNLPEAIAWYRKAAEQGSVKGQCKLGKLYREGGLQFEPDKEQALTWYRKAAEQGNAQAQFDLGAMYELGEGVPQNLQDAITWYRKAALQKHANAQKKLSEMYDQGKGVPQKPLEATEWYRAAAEQGDVEAEYRLGQQYDHASGREEAMIWYRKAAEHGHVKAQYKLGWIFDKAYWASSDDAQAIAWYRKAAEQGHAEALYRLGEIYEEKHHVPADFQQLLSLFHTAAEQGDAIAQVYLGKCYERGKSVTKDDVQALNWFRKAAGQGNAGGYYHLILMCEKGQGNQEDYARAVDWFRDAAKQGNVTAKNIWKLWEEEASRYRVSALPSLQYELARMYLIGKGVPKDDARAVDCFRNAADLGDVTAQFVMGVMYENGRGVPQDNAQAIEWYRKAAEQGYAKAQQATGLYRKAAERGYEKAQQALQRLLNPQPARQIRVQCGNCKKFLIVKAHLAGKKLKCPGCQNVVVVPVQLPEAHIETPSEQESS